MRPSKKVRAEGTLQPPPAKLPLKRQRSLSNEDIEYRKLAANTTFFDDTHEPTPKARRQSAAEYDMYEDF
jgi:hypothetical protein